MNSGIAILGFAAFSGTGKTTLLEQLIPLLKKRELRVSVIKHAHHQFDIDHEGKDSFRLRKAGAVETLVASRTRWALIHETQQVSKEPELSYLLSRLDTRQVDLILVEGFKHEAFPRIELWRKSLGKSLLYTDDKNIIAIATDEQLTPEPAIPNLDINQPEQIADFIAQYVQPNILRKEDITT